MPPKSKKTQAPISGQGNLNHFLAKRSAPPAPCAVPRARGEAASAVQDTGCSRAKRSRLTPSSATRAQPRRG